MRVALLAAFLLFDSASLAAIPPCANCHLEVSRKQRISAHAESLKPVRKSLFYSQLPGVPLGETRGGFFLNFAPSSAGLEVNATRGEEKSSGIIEWIFGAGRRAETPVASLGTQMVELRISYYALAGKYDLTFGHRPGISHSAKEALGIVQPTESMQRCFGCHSTGGSPGSSDFRAGVHCEGCHSVGAGHPEAGAQRNSRDQLNPGAVLNLCGRCHRREPEGNADDVVNVRYQAVRLQRSRCFRSGSLSCLTCHDPHVNARTDAGWYRQQCLGCHAEVKHSGKPAGAGINDCVECHMPRVPITSRLVFTDHWIRKGP